MESPARATGVPLDEATLQHAYDLTPESLQALRRQSRWRRQVRAVRDFFWDHTGSLLLLLAGLTLLVCAVRIRMAQIGLVSDSQHAWEPLAPLLIG